MNEVTMNILVQLVTQLGVDDTLRFILEIKKLNKAKVENVVQAIGRDDLQKAKTLAERHPPVEATPTTRVLWMLLTKAKLSKTAAKDRLHSELKKLIGNNIPTPGRTALDKWVEQLMVTSHASAVMRAAMIISENPGR